MTALRAEETNREIAAAPDPSEKAVETGTGLAVGVTRVGPAEEARTHARLQ